MEVSTKVPAKGPQFLEFAIPLIEALRERGGSATTSEVYDAIVEKAKISEAEQLRTLKNGVSSVKNRIAWCKMYLDRGGFVISSKRGVWDLTEKGARSNLSQEDVLALFREIHPQLSKRKGESQGEEESREDAEEPVEQADAPTDYRRDLLATLLGLPPSGFERLCQRLLRESGCQQVEVTGKSGDGGIDGVGILQVNPLVSFKVLFQCKRYTGSVSTSVVRDFRGALQGRADKGIIITTGQFTREARQEAIRDGATPIELVDGEKLIDMFASLELGLVPRQEYDLDEAFFRQFE